MPPCPVPSERDRRRDRTQVISFDPLPEQSIRTALILDRFSVNCTIMYCSNDSLLSTTACMGRSFFDFVARKDEDLVRSWIDVIKSWGVNERGQPSDGGFGFGKFNLLVRGRDSRYAIPTAPLPFVCGGALRRAAHNYALTLSSLQQHPAYRPRALAPPERFTCLWPARVLILLAREGNAEAPVPSLGLFRASRVPGQGA